MKTICTNFSQNKYIVSKSNANSQHAAQHHKRQTPETLIMLYVYPEAYSNAFQSQWHYLRISRPHKYTRPTFRGKCCASDKML